MNEFVRPLETKFVDEVERRVVQGKTSMVECLIQATQAALGGINTSYTERINATFRQRMAPLARRSRHLVSI